MKRFKEFIYQKYSWFSLAWFLFTRMVFYNPIRSMYHFVIGNYDKSLWHYKETKESFWWLKIHLTYRSKRIK